MSEETTRLIERELGQLQIELAVSPVTLLPTDPRLVPAALEEAWQDVSAWAAGLRRATATCAALLHLRALDEAATELARAVAGFEEAMTTLVSCRIELLEIIESHPPVAYCVGTGRAVPIHLNAAKVLTRSAVMVRVNAEELSATVGLLLERQLPERRRQRARRPVLPRPSAAPHQDEYLTTQQAAEALNFKPATIRSWLAGGRLRGTKSHEGRGGQWRIARSELSRFAQRHIGRTSG